MGKWRDKRGDCPWPKWGNNIMLTVWSGWQGKVNKYKPQSILTSVCDGCRYLLARVTSAPSWANILAMPAPSPVPPPVTNATVPTNVSFGNIGIFLAGNISQRLTVRCDVDIGRVRIVIFHVPFISTKSSHKSSLSQIFCAYCYFWCCSSCGIIMLLCHPQIIL